MAGNFWIGLFTGLTIGWVIEWLIDRAYWRHRFDRIEEQLQDTRDQLKNIKGVSKPLEKRLNQAGIYSFKAMAALTPEELEHIAGDEKFRMGAEDLIKQAGRFAKKRKKKK